jgi:ribonuclease R
LPNKTDREKSNPLDKSRVLEALAKEPHGTKRDIARALGVKGNDRIALKRILRELEDEGVIARAGKRAYAKPGQ